MKIPTEFHPTPGESLVSMQKRIEELNHIRTYFNQRWFQQYAAQRTQEIEKEMERLKQSCPDRD